MKYDVYTIHTKGTGHGKYIQGKINMRTNRRKTKKTERRKKERRWPVASAKATAGD